MARRYGRIETDLWLKDNWRELGPAAQLVYLMLISQPNLSLVGVVDYRPKKWTVLTGLPPDRVKDAVDTLERGRFVVVDDATEELLVRSFTRYDGIQIANPKLRKGFWSAYKSVVSAMLRKVAVDNMPDEVFAMDFATDIPDDALRFRRSAPMDWPIRSVPDSAIGSPPTSTLHPTTDIHPPIAASNGHPADLDWLERIANEATT